MASNVDEVNAQLNAMEVEPMVEDESDAPRGGGGRSRNRLARSKIKQKAKDKDKGEKGAAGKDGASKDASKANNNAAEVRRDAVTASVEGLASESVSTAAEVVCALGRGISL